MQSELQKLVAPFDVGALDAEPSTIYAVTDDLRIAYVNPAWRTFALANGADWKAGEWGIGARLMDAIPAPLQPAYQAMFDRVRAGRTMVEQEYDCSTPALHRQYRMQIYPCTSGGMLVIHALMQEKPHGRSAQSAQELLYRNEHGFIVQCCHCRCVMRTTPPLEWHWVPDFISEAPRNISHGLCPLCQRHYYAI